MLVLETDETPEDRSPAGEATPSPHARAARNHMWHGLAALIPHEPPALPGDPAAAERIFARRLKRERLRRGWRQEDLAAQLAKLGIELHPSAIAKIEREPDPGKRIEPRMIRLNEAVLIAKAFRLPLEEMLSDRDLSDSVRELAILQDRLMQAHSEAATARAAADQALDRAANLQARLHEAELRASLFRKLNVGDGEDSRILAERFLDYWLGRERSDLITSGWGRNDRGELRGPDEVLRYITPIAQLWPDLGKACAELTAKIEADAKWWIDEGRRLHEEWLHEQMQFSVGDRVYQHPFGTGTVVAIETSPDGRATVKILIDKRHEGTQDESSRPEWIEVPLRPGHGVQKISD